MKEPNFRDKQLGRNIRDIRLKKGMTLEEFCNEFEDPKPSPSIISRWERGISMPNPKRLQHLSKISGIEVSELYKRGMDFFDGQLAKLSTAYEEHHSEIKHDISQSYNLFRLGYTYLSFASIPNNKLLTEYEEFLWLVNQLLDSNRYNEFNLSYSDTRNSILKQLDRIHLLLTYPSFIADAKDKLDEWIEPKETKTNAVVPLMKKAKNELLDTGIVSDETAKEFCEIMGCNKDFAIKFLNNNLDFTNGHDFDE